MADDSVTAQFGVLSERIALLVGNSCSFCGQTPQCIAPLCCVKGQPPSVFDVFNRISEAARVLQFV